MASSFSSVNNPYSSQNSYGGMYSGSIPIATPGHAPDDANDLTTYAKIMATTGGNLTVLPATNDDAAPVTFTGILAGWVCPFLVRRLYATGTTCAPISLRPNDI
jgi:hypothetical protein